MNLAIADMTVATFLAPRYIFIHTFIHPDGVAGNILCRLLTGGNFAWVGAGASVFTLVTIATERYFAVMYPFENKGKLSSRKLKVRKYNVIKGEWFYFNLIFTLLQKYQYRREFCLDWRWHISFTLVAVATERYFAALHPFDKKGKFSARRIKVCLSLLYWFACTTLKANELFLLELA